MTISRIPTGCDSLDHLLNGGYELDVTTTVYGPAGSGKTLFCLMALLKTLERGKKAIFIDTEGGYSSERVQQLSQHTAKYDNILLFHPTTFEEQKEVFDKLKLIATDKVGIIIVDSISMLYRLKLGGDEVPEVNRELGAQISLLNEIARKKNIPVLITNQVYANFDDRTKINIVGGDILKYGSKCLLELQITPDNKRRLILRKHRSIPNDKSFLYMIEEHGVKEVKNGSFRLF